MVENHRNGLPEGFKMTELGPLPKEWEVVKLGHIAEVKYGKANPKSSGKIPVVGSGGIFSSTDIALVDFPTIVIGRKGTAGKVWLSQSPCYPSDTTFYLQWKTNLDVAFLFHFMSLKPLSGEHAKTTLPSLQKPYLENMALPLPPLPEQKAIARVLSTIQRAVEAQDKVIAAARQLKKSLMRHLFTYGPVPVSEAEKVPLKETEIGPVPAHWEVVRLGEVADKPQYGFTTSGSSEKVGPKFLRISDIQNSGVNWASVPYCRCSPMEEEKYLLRTGDVLIARIGATTGKTFLIKDCPHAVFASYLIRVRPYKTRLSPEFLNEFTATQSYWSQVNASKGGRLKQGINIPVLNGILIPLPPLPEQQEIARILAAVDRKIEAEEKRKAALQTLFKTMLQLLMTGRLRVNKPGLLEEN